jgi:hypothetical protein
MARRKNPLGPRAPAPLTRRTVYVPPGHYLTRDVHNKEHTVKAHRFEAGEVLPNAVRFIRRIARGEMPPDIARSRARYFIARYDADR